MKYYIKSNRFFTIYIKYSNLTNLKIEIINKNIVMCLYNDTALYWVHTLTKDKEYACINENWLVYYSKKFDLYNSIGGPGRIRTFGQLIKSQLLYH